MLYTLSLQWLFNGNLLKVNPKHATSKSRSQIPILFRYMRFLLDCLCCHIFKISKMNRVNLKYKSKQRMHISPHFSTILPSVDVFNRYLKMDSIFKTSTIICLKIPVFSGTCSKNYNAELNVCFDYYFLDNHIIRR